jgi:LysR family transcriptional regulator (chromosome initiation inhibitor)
MELDQLRALAAVVDHETFDAAAGELRLTPSAVSQRIKALERSVGSVLVRRLKPVRPTPAGEQLLRSARQLLLLADEAILALRGPA